MAFGAGSSSELLEASSEEDSSLLEESSLEEDSSLLEESSLDEDSSLLEDSSLEAGASLLVESSLELSLLVPSSATADTSESPLGVFSKSPSPSDPSTVW